MASDNSPIDIASLSAQQKMELADALHDVARQESEAAPFSPEQMHEIERRLAAADAGEETLMPWDELSHELAQMK